MKLGKALAWNAISQLSQSGIQFASIVLLARVLTPDDFGVIGIITIFISISQALVDSEMGGALLGKKEVKPIDYSTLFIYNIAISLLLYLSLFFVAPLIADFYDNADLVPAIRILGINILIHAFAVTQRVMLLRGLHFKQMAVINIISGSLSLGVAIVMALHGFGFWAIVAQQIAFAVVSVGLMMKFNNYLPQPKFSKSAFKEQFAFAGSLLGANILKSIADNINTNLIAKIMPLKQVGYYVQSSRLSNFGVTFVGSIMNQTLFPMMAKYNSREMVTSTFLNFFELSAAALLFITTWVVLFAEPIISIILGEQWISATFTLQLLALSILPCMIQILCRNLLKTTKNTKRVLTSQIVQSVLILLSVVVTYHFGMDAIIIGYVVAQALAAVQMIYVTCDELSVKFWQQLWVVVKHLMISAACGGSLYAILLYAPQFDSAFVLLIGGFVAQTVIYMVLCSLFGARALFDVCYSMIAKIIKRR